MKDWKKVKRIPEVNRIDTHSPLCPDLDCEDNVHPLHSSLLLFPTPTYYATRNSLDDSSIYRCLW